MARLSPPTRLFVVSLLLLISFLINPIFALASEASLDSPKTLDGVKLEAVETYLTPNQNEINVGTGLYPFNSYFQGLAVIAGYTYHASRNFAWEVVHGTLFTSFDTGLTTQLADVYGVNPESIEKLQYIVSSSINYAFAYGKLIFFEDLIRYFRTSVILGGALVNTSVQNYFAPNFGLKLEVFSGTVFSWRLEVRDALSFQNTTNYVDFSLGIGFNF